MNRQEKSRSVKTRILDVARDLLLSKGYRATTTREIIEKAGITTGSLYHFFRNKEDMLLNIVIEIYNEAMEAINGIIGKDEDPILHYALVYTLEMKAVKKYDRIAELYLQSYSSWYVTETMLPFQVRRNRAFFHKYNPEFTDQDYYLRTLALRGMELSFITEQVNAGKMDYEEKSSLLIESGLSLFNVPESKREETISKALELSKKNSLMICGFRI